MTDKPIIVYQGHATAVNLTTTTMAAMDATKPAITDEAGNSAFILPSRKNPNRPP
jgi:hypothetical protein